MSVEHQPSAPEQKERISSEINELGHERLEELRKNPENSHEDDPQKRVEKAREIIHKQEKTPEPPAPETEQKKPAAIPFFDHKLNYAQTLASVQRKLSPVSRSFSRVIHSPVVEKTSEALEKTVARPSVTAGALWTALIVGALFYFTARSYGYSLSGSEITLSFIIGGTIGILIEGFLRMFRRRGHR